MAHGEGDHLIMGVFFSIDGVLIMVGWSCSQAKEGSRPKGARRKEDGIVDRLWRSRGGRCWRCLVVMMV